MEKGEEIDQFKLLEEKFDALINFMANLKKEKEALTEKVQIQDEKIADLNSEVDNLKSARDKARQRIISLLERIEQLGI